MSKLQLTHESSQEGCAIDRHCRRPGARGLEHYKRRGRDSNGPRRRSGHHLNGEGSNPRAVWAQPAEGEGFEQAAPQAWPEPQWRGFESSHGRSPASGGGGIRTLGRAQAPQRFSRPPRSTTPAPLRVPARADSSRVPMYGGQARDLSACAQRRAAKNSRSCAAAASARRPESTCGRWLSRCSPVTSSTEPHAPALGSVVA